MFHLWGGGALFFLELSYTLHRTSSRVDWDQFLLFFRSIASKLTVLELFKHRFLSQKRLRLQKNAYVCTKRTRFVHILKIGRSRPFAGRFCSYLNMLQFPTCLSTPGGQMVKIEFSSYLECPLLLTLWTFLWFCSFLLIFASFLLIFAPRANFWLYESQRGGSWPCSRCFRVFLIIVDV